jgi:ribonuclease HII
MSSNRKSLKELRASVAAAPLPATRLMKELAADPRKGAQALYRSLQRRQEAATARKQRDEAMLQFERAAQAQGFMRVAGVDEAGRGPLAGPVVAAAVVLAEPLTGINDSKQLTWEQREAYYAALFRGAHSIGVSVVAPSVIDQYGIQHANYQAMAQATQDLSPAPDYLLIDGFNVPGLRPPQERLVKGDSRSQSIAAASVIAKVTRDRLMAEYDKEYPAYGFAAHKGYGTQAHLDAIAAHGPCPIHRMSFAPLSQIRETGELF